MRLLAALTVLLLTTCVSAQEIPEFDGVFAVATLGCDCDPRDFVFRTTATVQGYDRPAPSSSRVRTVDPNRLIEGNDWSDAITVTSRAGRARARRAMTLRLVPVRGTRFPTGRVDFSNVVDVRVSPSSDVRVLADLGEAMYYVSVDGRLYFDDGLQVMDASRFTQTQNLVDESWFYLTPKPGKPAAWVRVSWWDGSGGARNAEMLCSTHTMC